MQTGRVVITGAGSLGRELALRYARAGWRVTMADIDATRGRGVCRVQALGADAARPSPNKCRRRHLGAGAARAVRAHFGGGVDHVVNNAGVASAGDVVPTFPRWRTGAGCWRSICWGWCAAAAYRPGPRGAGAADVW